MTVFGYRARLPFTKAAVSPMTLSDWNRGWTRIYESFTGAWQRNIEYSAETVLAFAAVYRCVTLIASDIGKLRIKLVQRDADGVWSEFENTAHSPVLRKPNHYQTRIRFIEQWLISKLTKGNAYILKGRDQRSVVTRLYVLDPSRVKVKVTPDGQIFYELASDNLSGINDVLAPASEVIHDLMNPIFHPLCGTSPITACGLAAYQGLKVQENSAKFFANDSRPSGTLTGPGTIPDETATRLQREWQENFSGENYGQVAVLGNGLEYKAMTVSAEDAQLIDQLKWTSENVCTAFGVPGYMIGVGSPPTYNNIEALNQQYYSQCLQAHIEAIEALLDEGLNLDPKTGTEFDLDDLLRMDTPTRVKAAAEATGSGNVSPNEARRRWFNLKPVTGGESPYLQQQNYSLAALAKRDAKADPFEGKAPERPALPAPDVDKTIGRFRVKAYANQRIEQRKPAA